MQVKDTYCLDEWEKYYIEKPLSFVEFVDTYKSKACIHSHIMEKIKEISEDKAAKEYYIQGFIGSGKSTLTHLLTIYRIYLFLILKSPKDFYNLSENTEFNVAIFVPKNKKVCYNLTIHPLLETLDRIPFFAKARTIDEFEKVDSAYTTAIPTDALTFKNNGNVLRVNLISTASDLIGRTVVIGVMTELQYAIEEYELSYNSLYNYMVRLRDRIDSRCKGKGCTFIMEKNPGYIWDDILDQYIYSSFDIPYRKLILFKNRWDYFKTDDPLDSWINLYSGEVTKEKPVDTEFEYVNFPSIYGGVDLLTRAIKHPKEFIKDWIGVPVQFGMNKKSYDVMKQIKEDMEKYHIELSYKHGKMYLECYQDDVSLCLEKRKTED